MEEILLTKENYRDGLKVRLTEEGYNVEKKSPRKTRDIFIIKEICDPYDNACNVYINPPSDKLEAFWFKYLCLAEDVINSDTVIIQLDNLARKYDSR